MVEDKLYSLDIPQREGKEGYIGTFFTLYLKLGTVLQSPEFSKEPIRLFYMSEFIISLIPDEKARSEVRTSLKNRKKILETEFRKEAGREELTAKEKDHILIQASLQTIGDVSDYIDKHIGISDKNKIGFIRKKTSYKSGV